MKAASEASVLRHVASYLTGDRKFLSDQPKQEDSEKVKPRGLLVPEEIWRSG